MPHEIRVILVKWGHLWSSVPPIISNGFEFDRHLGQDFSARTWLRPQRSALFISRYAQALLSQISHLFITIILLVICFYHFCYSLNVFLLFNKFLQTCKKKETAYLVPRVTITYYRVNWRWVVGGQCLKQKFILSLFRRPEVWIKVPTRLAPSGGSEGDSCSHLQSPTGGCQQLLLFLGLKLYHSNFYLHYHVGFSRVYPLCLSKYFS